MTTDVLADDQEDGSLKEFAIQGVCNICIGICMLIPKRQQLWKRHDGMDLVDYNHQQYIMSGDGLSIIVRCLESDNVEIVLAALTTLMYLITEVNYTGMSWPIQWRKRE